MHLLQSTDHCFGQGLNSTLCFEPKPSMEQQPREEQGTSNGQENCKQEECFRQQEPCQHPEPREELQPETCERLESSHGEELQEAHDAGPQKQEGHGPEQKQEQGFHPVNHTQPTSSDSTNLKPNLLTVPVSEIHFTEDSKPIKFSNLPPISTCQSESINSHVNSRTSNHSNPGSPHSSSTSIHDEDDSGPDCYTSESESDSEFSPKQLAKRERLRIERDKIKPSYYYGEKELEEEALQKGVKPPKLKQKGLRGVPVFEPSMEQYRDFYSYINQIDRWGMRSGIVKIIPPKEWSEKLPNLGQESLRTDGEGQMLRNAKIKSPISQVIQGSRGLFRVMNVAKRKNYNALEWYDLANSDEHRPPDFSNKTLDTESKPRSSGFVQHSYDQKQSSQHEFYRTYFSQGPKSPSPENLQEPSDYRYLHGGHYDQNSPEKRDVEEHADCSPSKLPPVPEGRSLPQESANDNPAGSPDPKTTASVLLPPSSPSESPKAASIDQDRPENAESVTANCSVEAGQLQPPNQDEPRISDAAVESQDVQMSSTTPDQLTLVPTETPKEMITRNQDALFRPGRHLKNGRNSLSGMKSSLTMLPSRTTLFRFAEISNKNIGGPLGMVVNPCSLFDERTKDWNVANLDNLLNRLKLRKKIPGVNTPYLYFGTWRASDLRLARRGRGFILNQLHSFWSSKVLVFDTTGAQSKFESFMSSSFAKERRTCSQFLRHKAFLASPAVLQDVGVQLNKVVHLPGEIILTYPYGYHSGFNWDTTVPRASILLTKLGSKRAGRHKLASVLMTREFLHNKHDLPRTGLAESNYGLAKRSVTINVMHGYESMTIYAVKRATPKNGLRRNSGDSKSPKSAKNAKKRQCGCPEKPKAPRKSRPKKKPGTDADGNIINPKPSDAPDKTLKRKHSSSAPGATHSTSKKASSAPPKKVFPCVLCPDPSEEVSPPMTADAPSLPKVDFPTTQIGENPESSKTIQPLKTHPSRPKPIKWAHRICCMFTPSTWFEIYLLVKKSSKASKQSKKLVGMKCQCARKRWELKFNVPNPKVCESMSCDVWLKSGAFFLDAKIVKEELSYSLLDPPAEGAPPGLDVGQDPTLIVLCKQHNPIYQKSEADRKARELADKIAQFVPSQALKVRTSKGVFQVFFLSRDEASKTLQVTFEDGHSTVLAYNKVYFGSAETSAKKADQNSQQNNQQSTDHCQQVQSQSNFTAFNPVPTMARGDQPIINDQGNYQTTTLDGPSINPYLTDPNLTSSFQLDNIQDHYHDDPNFENTELDLEHLLRNHIPVQQQQPQQFPDLASFDDHVTKPYYNNSLIDPGLIDSRLL
ncbi:hypothetical protein PSTT_04099 [Puccinia striiformis]|uniref:JmjN domain-containing protein n=1 Tax=Puccinia striiformis TaxID=27350 RepID=A0A2S4VTP2_9BASI|nr:hypothetical protein PSTT_04099 [Puccinia striiformis]